MWEKEREIYRYVDRKIDRERQDESERDKEIMKIENFAWKFSLLIKLSFNYKILAHEI